VVRRGDDLLGSSLTIAPRTPRRHHAAFRHPGRLYATTL
jgi:hypothetical protein